MTHDGAPTRIACLLGSPRDGNSSRIARRFCERARDAGATVEIFTLADLAFSGCRNLFHCKTGGDRCGLDDDLTPVLESVRAADILVLASPVYFTDVTSFLKAAIERFFSFFVPDYATNPVKSRLAPGKTLVFVQTQSEPETAYRDLMERYAQGFRMLGYEAFHLIRAAGIREPGATAERSDVWARVDEVAATLFGSPQPRPR